MDRYDIKDARTKLHMTQEEFAESLGVTFASVNRWENGKAKPHRSRIKAIQSLLADQKPHGSPLIELADEAASDFGPRIDFSGLPDAVQLAIDAVRLQNGHLYNKTFGLELSRVVPLPHQRIAVYENLLPLNTIRFLLADDAGAGKTIMAGLLILELLKRGRIKSALIVCPAGLTWNWRRELKHFFDLNFKILTGKDFESENPLTSDDGLYIISVDTAATTRIRNLIGDEPGLMVDLVIFDEAHKLSWTDEKRKKTRRYLLGEILSRRSRHLLLLTATPHMGKPFPYFALWRLLDPNVFSTPQALEEFPEEKRQQFFLRRLKEEMVDYQGRPLYKPRLCQTVSHPLSASEREFYDSVSEYLKWSFENNRKLNKNAAAMVVAVLQRRLASSTFSLVESLRRRKDRIATAEDEPAMSQAQFLDPFEEGAADDSEPTVDGRESIEDAENELLESLISADSTHRVRELAYLDAVLELGEAILSQQDESKFSKLRELIESAQFQNEQILIFTEHRDTLDYLRNRFEELGYTGQVAAIHGGMPVEEREYQRIFFMPPSVRKEQGLSHDRPGHARIMLATDAAGEGINLQFAWLMVNYDIPFNPARLEQRMGRLHRFGLKHAEVRIFNLVADGTREGRVLEILLHKLNDAREALSSDKVFDVVGQQLSAVSLKDLLLDALLDGTGDRSAKKVESIMATTNLRRQVEAVRKKASSYGDVGRRLGELNAERETERLNQMLPAFIGRFFEKAAPQMGIDIQGDLYEKATFSIPDRKDRWLRRAYEVADQPLPAAISLRPDFQISEAGNGTVSFLRPGEVMFDALCQEVKQRFTKDARRGSVFRDPQAESPYYIAVYTCQVVEPRNEFSVHKGRSGYDYRLFALQWDESGKFKPVAVNRLLALEGAPELISQAGKLIVSPASHAEAADGQARSYADTYFLQELRQRMKLESVERLRDLARGFDFQMSQLAEQRRELSRKLRDGDMSVQKRLQEVKEKQAALSEERSKAMLREEHLPEMLEVGDLQRLAIALVVPDPSKEAREAFDRDIEAMAVRIATNYEVDHYSAKVFDVSNPRLGKGYDLESHRANGEKVAIEVKGRSGRGTVHMTENEWPTAANVREKYYLYCVFNCASSPELFRVQDPFGKLLVKSQHSFTITPGQIIREAEPE